MRRGGTAQARVLLVESRAESREALGRALVEAGYEVTLAASGSFAVSALEAEYPDVIVSGAKVQDMDGYELFTRVRKDPTTSDTPFLLLAGWNRPAALAASEAGANMVLTGEFTLDTVVSRVGELVAHAGAAAQERPPDRVRARPAMEPLWAAVETARARSAREAGKASFQGSLGVMELAEVTQAIALGGKSGCLVLALTAGDGLMRFEGGRLVHASFGRQTGEAAFAALIQASQHETDASFRFEQVDRADLSHLPKTISRSVDQLLLSIAADIDEGGTGEGQLCSARPEKEG